MIQEKDRRLQNAFNLQVEVKSRSNFTFSKSHGESCDADCSVSVTAIPEFCHLCSEYHQSDVFNADFCSLYYTAVPTKTIGTSFLLGRKKTKERVTFLMYSNANGSESIPPLIIGK